TQGAGIRSFLRGIPAKVRDLTGCRLFREPRDAAAARGELWWAHATFHNCWDESIRDYFVSDCPDAWLLQVLRNYGNKEYLQELEETRNPVLCADVFSYVHVHDEDQILSLLSLAPTVWIPPTVDHPIGTWTGKFTAPLILDTIANHALNVEHLIAVYAPASQVGSER